MKNRKTILILTVCIILSLAFYENIYAEEFKSEKNGLDIIFVMDYSGSMKGNDSDYIAQGMVKAFIDTVHSADIRIGFVSYNDRILSSTSPVAVSTPKEREALKQLIDAAGYSGNTDIGLGLRYAYGLLEQETDRKKIIVLISDGESDLKGSTTGRVLEHSEMDIRQTIEGCHNQSIPIYTVAFGTYEGNTVTLKEIADQTNAGMYTVERPEALIEILYGIFNNQMAYHIQDISAGIYAQGRQNIRLKLDEAYLDELDVLLISPQSIGSSSVLYGEQQIGLTNLNHYAVAKIPEVDAGIKELTVQTETVQDQELKVFLISYRNLTPVLEVETSTGRNAALSYKVYFRDQEGNVIADEAFYKSLNYELSAYAEGQEERKGLDTSLAEGIITGQTSFPHSGTYYIEGHIDDLMETNVFQPVRIQVVNTPPSGQLPEDIHCTILSGETAYMLGDYFKDVDGDAIRYELDRSQAEKLETKLENGVLTIKPLKSGVQQITLRLSDGEEIVNYSFSVRIVPLWQAYWWVIVLACIAAAAILWKTFHKPKPELEEITEKKAGNRFAGKMDGYFTMQPEGEEEIPPLTFPMYKIKDSRVCLGDLMKEYPEASDNLGLNQIFLIADEERKIILYHSSLSTIMIGSSIACRQIQYSISFGDIIYVTSQSGAYELEIHYIAMI